MADIGPNISVNTTDQATIVTFSDRRILEDGNIRSLQESIMAVIEQSAKICLVLDFCNVEFLSSAVLGLLIRISKKIHEREGKLSLCNISPKIYEVFKITQLTKVFDIYADVDSALYDLT